MDIWFTPSTRVMTASSELGILSRIAATPCLLEPFRKQPTEREIRSCLGKLIHLEADLHRQANRDEETIAPDELPRLWIITASCSDKLLNKLMAREDETWLKGIYFTSKVFLTGIIAIDKLPETPETLWLRILGKGLVQQQAIAEVIALSKEDIRRSAVVKLLATWKVSIEVSGSIGVEERELIMNLSQAYLEWEQKTELRGVEIGKEQERREIVENLLLARFGELDSQLVAIVRTISNLPATEYALLLLQLSSLSREDLLARFESFD